MHAPSNRRAPERVNGDGRDPLTAHAGPMLEGFSSPDDSPSLLLTIDDVAHLVRMSIRQIQRWKSAGWFPQELNIGGNVRWRRADIEAWVAAGCPKLGNRR